MENALENGRKDVLYAFERANCELAKKILEVDQMKIDLAKWKSSAETVKVNLEGNQKFLKQEKESLLGIAKEQDEKLGCFEQQIVILESTVAEKMEALEVLKQEKEKYFRILEIKDSRIEKLEDEIARLKQEEEIILESMKEKDQSIDNLSTQVMSVRQDFESAISSSISLVKEKQFQIDAFNDALEKAENLKKLEMQDLIKKIDEREKEVNDLRQKVMFQAESHISEKHCLLEDIKKVLEEREDLLILMEGVSNWISHFSGKDGELIEILEKILHHCENRNGHATDLGSDGLSDSPSKGIGTHLPSSMKSIEESVEKRSPLKTFNHQKL